MLNTIIAEQWWRFSPKDRVISLLVFSSVGVIWWVWRGKFQSNSALFNCQKFHDMNKMFSLSLYSSISSMLNSLAAVTWEDFLKLRFSSLSERNATKVTRTLGKVLHLEMWQFRPYMSCAQYITTTAVSQIFVCINFRGFSENDSFIDCTQILS